MIEYNEALRLSMQYFGGNELAASTFLNKYALKDPKGKLLETTPDDMHRRLAKEFARIEAKYPNPLSEEEIYSYLKDFKKLIPQGSPMAGIGNKSQLLSLSNCVHGESLVYTKEIGLVKMRDVVPGLHVLTHKGRFRKVLRHWSNGLKETYTVVRSFSNKPVAVTTEQEMGRFCAVTADHRIYTKSGEWETVENLLGKHNKALMAPAITLPGVTEGADLSVVPLGLGRTALLDETLAWIFGLYFAEGAIKNRNELSPSVYFTLAKNEIAMAERISAWSEANLGHKAWIQTWDGLNFIQVNVFDKFFGRFMLDNFGSGFNKKRIPEWVFALPENIRASFLDGFMSGDATNYESLDADYNVFSIANPTLAYELGLLARSVGKKVRFNFQATGKLIKHRTATVSMSSANEVIKFIKSPVLAEVFDMEVEEDHSFVAGDIICHNCFVIDSPWDSYSGITYTDSEMVSLMKRRAGVGFDISNLRPLGTFVANAAGTSTGIGGWMERYSRSTREVCQDGRRGALMISISCRHPEIETFITIKEDLQKVTGANVSIRFSDDFMNAVKNDEEFMLRWPVEGPEEQIQIKKMVRAKDIWNKFVKSAWTSAEPGALFWDTATRLTPSDCYADYGFKSISTNPCFAGDTLIAVADGRNAVSIKQLAEDGKDVPVYSLDPSTGISSIKMARNPRVTGYGKKLVRITLDNGTHFDVTPDHKCLLRDGTTVLAKDLKAGDSLPRFKKEQQPVKKGDKNYWLVYANSRNFEDQRIFEHRLIAQFNQPEKWNEVYGNAKEGGWAKTGGLVVHHKDYNGLNNSPDNLEIMTFMEHQKFHAEHDNKGEKNGRCYVNVTNEMIKKHALELTSALGRRFSNKEWLEYAGSNNLPQTFSEWRRTGFYNSAAELAQACAIELNIEYSNVDPRLVKTLQSMLSQGYKAEIVDSEVKVQKTCEICRSNFQISHVSRETAFCSIACSAAYVNSDKKIAEKRIANRNSQAKEQANKNKESQARIFSALKFALKREPMLEEWEAECKAEKIPFRIGKVLKHGFKSWNDVKEAGNAYNHKVLSVTELEGDHTVYNLTVDDNHTVNIVTLNEENIVDGVSVRNCGEIILSGGDSCRLLLVNSFAFVKNPFTKEAVFDFNEFTRVSRIGQRLMDDLVDLELEAIDKILEKIESDPEPNHIKRSEYETWLRIKNACTNGRRTGLGQTAVGDVLAALGMIYGSDDSIGFTENLYKTFTLASYKESVNLAKERGTFPVFSHGLEKGHEFLEKIWAADAELYQEYLKHGRRNIANTTTPPAGTTSMMACVDDTKRLFGTSSGIEPAYLLFYKRRKKVNPNDKDVKVDFVDDLGDKWQEFFVHHNPFKLWMELNGKTEENVSESPYYKATANDIDWVRSVDIQAAAQKWICHSISKTCNLPNSTTQELVSDVYLRAWESGCKGFTIYRDGSRSGVLVSADSKTQKTEKFASTDAPKRPKDLVCDIHHCTVQGEKWTMFVGLLEGKPYEIMGGLAKYVKIPKRVTRGKLVKHNGNINPARYDLHYDFEDGPENETVIQDVGNVFENPTHAGFTRMVSLSLRHGAPIQYVVEQLVKGSDKESDLFSVTKAFSRVLKGYIKDGTKTGLKKCPDCGSDRMAYKDGCVQCLDCGSSKCS